MPKASKFSPDEGLTIYDLKDSEAVHYGEQSKGYVGKNLIQNTANSQTKNGVTFTVNDDKSVSLSGTSTGNTFVTLYSLMGSVIKSWGNTLILSGGSQNAYFNIHKSDFSYNKQSWGEDKAIDTTVLEDNTEYKFSIGIDGVKNVNSMVIKPMLRFASISDSTYEPYLTPNTDLMSYADNAVLGAKSLLNYSSIEINPNADTGTITDNGLSGINVNITKESGHWTDIVFKCNIVLKAGVAYKLSCLGIPNNVKGIRLGDGISFVFSMDNGATSATYTPSTDITIKNWTTTLAVAEADTITFTYYPMLYFADDTDNTYQPPNVLTNYELSKEIVKKPNKEYQTWGTSHSFTIEKNSLSVLLTYGGGGGELSACIPINRGGGGIGYNASLVPTGLTLSANDGTLTVSSSNSFIAAMIFVM